MVGPFHQFYEITFGASREIVQRIGEKLWVSSPDLALGV